MENLSRIVTAVLILLILTIGASYTSAAPPDVSVAQQTIDPDPPAVSAVASDVGTARWMNDIESKRESAASSRGQAGGKPGRSHLLMRTGCLLHPIARLLRLRSSN